jgi:malate dehydrogenase
MNRRLAVIGATGAVGSTFIGQLLRSHLLEADDELILVGHGDPQGDSRLLASRIDLLDAFDEQRVKITFCPDPADLQADIVVMTAGVTISADLPTRRHLAAANIGLFQHLAQVCVARLPDAIFIVVSNPVELAVELFSQKTSPHHVIGMGAQQDSLRFARAIADSLGLSRHEVQATVLGEHGAAMLPVWSSVTLLTDTPAIHAQLATLRATCDLGERDNPADLDDLDTCVANAREQVTSLLEQAYVQQAYDLMLQGRPDVRIFIEPFITAKVLHSTPNATSNATLQCVAAALTNDPQPLHGQVLSDGHFGDIHGVCGIPVTLSRSGWKASSHCTLTTAERARLQRCAQSIADANQIACAAS